MPLFSQPPLLPLFSEQPDFEQPQNYLHTTRLWSNFGLLGTTTGWAFATRGIAYSHSEVQITLHDIQQRKPSLLQSSLSMHVGVALW